MATKPYYDRWLTSDETRKLLAEQRAKKLKSHKGGIIYAIDGGGEALVMPARAGFQVQLFVGACPC